MNNDSLSHNIQPQARVKGLLIQAIKDETLVYDLATNQAFCLNSVCSAVWSECDGQKTINEIITTLKDKKQINSNKELIWLTLQELNKNNLLNKTQPISETVSGFNRREMIKRIGLATAFALPVITSIVAPKAAQAASGASSAGCASGCTLGNSCTCSGASSISCPSPSTINASVMAGLCISAAAAATSGLVNITAGLGANVCVYANACI